MLVTIKNFYDTCECTSFKMLKSTLEEKYCGKSISLHFRAPSGLRAVEFIDVLDDGNVIDSHTGLPIDLATLPSTHIQNKL
ncbi:hypothetical protein AVL57_00785 (plasmid) [Alteromonas stellipolaris]|uniref:Uncharacterized protein n=1 Tax=Alteromonas stellipolaris TaxID=233316 RepID=A0ABM5YPX2_9ALTE|nr:hypothetical protein AVL57_00785 [Alteromonas stellipolaris]